MRDTIDFNDQLSIESDEVDDVSVDRMLSPKYPLRQLPIS
jgi:hypothetical protein